MEYTFDVNVECDILDSLLTLILCVMLDLTAAEYMGSTEAETQH